MPSYRPAQQRVLMLVYHLYFLDASGAREMEGEAIEASNDEGAVENAWSRGWDGTVEVWQGIRRVARITPELPPAAA